MSNDVEWIYGLREQSSTFMDKMRLAPGVYRYSLLGDLGPRYLAPSVFALKIFYMTGVTGDVVADAMANVLSYTQTDGSIFDPVVYRKSFLRNLLASVKNRNWSNVRNGNYKLAESRQSYSSLGLFGEYPVRIHLALPLTAKGIAAYLDRLQWSKPWGAGSYFSHLMFYLGLARKAALINEDEYQQCHQQALQYVRGIEDSRSGCWFKGSSVSLRFKVNGAMKIISGFLAAGDLQINHPRELIDTCLVATSDEHACDNFNVIYVLKYALQALGEEYRKQEVVDFAHNRLRLYENHYYPEHGGFSFLQHKANDRYYDAVISRGLDEPDIHGTVMFLWGVSIIAELLDVQQQVGLTEFLT